MSSISTRTIILIVALFLSGQSGGSAANIVPASTAYIGAPSGLNLRLLPNSNGQVLATLPYQTEITLLSDSFSERLSDSTYREWHKIKSGTLVGWAAKEWLLIDVQPGKRIYPRILALHSEKKIFVKNSPNDRIVELGAGTMANPDPSGTVVAVSAHHFDVKSHDNFLLFYHLPDLKLVKRIPVNGPYCGLEWSPDGKRFVLDYGTCASRGKAVYAYPSFEKLTTFSSMGTLSWRNGCELIAWVLVPFPGLVSAFPEKGNCLLGVARLSSEATQLDVFMAPSRTHEYAWYKVAGTRFYYIAHHVPEENDWKEFAGYSGRAWYRCYVIENGQQREIPYAEIRPQIEHPKYFDAIGNRQKR